MKKHASITAVLILGVCLLTISCHRGTPAATASGEINLADFDTTVLPGNNFFEYVNGTWLKKNPIPASEAVWGSFNTVYDFNIIPHLYDLLKAAAADKNKAVGSAEQKAGDYFSLIMDSNKLNKEGISPLNSVLAEINSISDNKSLWSVSASLMKMGVNAMFRFGVGQDDKYSSKEICNLGQGGMLLPAKDYYTDNSDRGKMIRERFTTFETQLLEQLGETQDAARKDAEKVLIMESELAISAMSPSEERDVHAVYNKKTMKELEDETPGIDWQICLDTFGLKSVDSILVAQPEFMKKLSDLVKQYSTDDWKTYLRVHLLAATAGKLSDTLAAISFNFWDKTFRGVKVMKPRWKRAVEATSGALGEIVGQLYVAKYFSAATKEKVRVMVGNIISAYKDRINNLTWMSPDTKKYAIEKLDKITLKLCYPDKWRDYSALHIMNDAYVLNAFRVNEFNFNYEMNKLGKPVDRTEWDMSPQTVNAYYEPTRNEIVFPAGILQPPFFDTTRDDAMNYGAIGAVIGHELTHGFDDQGNQYDADGNMRKWWTNSDSSHYFSKLKLVIDQFNNYEIDSAHVKGDLTIGENTADLGGITIAYEALEKDLKVHPEGIVEGFTPEQRFFIAFAQVWRQNARPSYIRMLIKTNPHSPPMFRVLGPLSNMKEFYQAFNVKPGEAMYRPDSLRAVIW
jgi:putative endopeptidase